MPCTMAWKREGRSRSVWHLFILATLFLHVSANDDSESRPVQRLAALERAIVEPIQNVLEKGNTFVETRIEWVVNLSHNKIHPDLEPSAILFLSKASTDSPHDPLITSPPSLYNREASPEPQPPAPQPPAPLNCDSSVNAVKSSDASLLSQTVSNLQQQSAAAVSQAQAAQSQARAAQTSAEAAQTAAQSNADIANSAASSAQSSLSSISSSASIAVSSASQSVTVALSSANAASTAAASASSSASAAVASAQDAAQAAVIAAQSSASSSIALAQSSASSSIALAQSSASSSIALAQSSASSSIALMQQSASQSVAVAQSSANSVVSDAKATATLAMQQAKETISSAALQAAANVRASQVQAITATQIAIAIVGSVIGSSLLSILGYFLLVRYKKRKAERREQAALNRPYTRAPSMADRRVTNISNGRGLSGVEIDSDLDTQGDLRKSVSPNDFPVPGTHNPRGTKKFSWSSRKLAQEVQAPEPSLSKKVTLIYDPDNPTRPPTFVNKLDESLSSVSPFGSFRLSRDAAKEPDNNPRGIVDEDPKIDKGRKGSVIGTAI